jgi:hypothetical protein
MSEWKDLSTHAAGKSPMPREQAEALYTRFCRKFRRSGPKEGRRIITRLQWRDFEIVGETVLRCPRFTSTDPLFLISDGWPPNIWISDGPTLRDYFEGPHWQDDLHIVDESLRWCLAVTHDDHYNLVDPERVLGVSGTSNPWA